MGKILFIEGTDDTTNGTLGQGFYKLLSQRLKGRMPKINMGEGKSQTIKKFKNNKFSRLSYLLIDLDEPEENKEPVLSSNQIFENKNFVFFMVQEMEAWFLSQPAMLDKYYNEKISKKLPAKPAKDIEKPSDFLQNITRLTKKGKYHKVQDGTRLLELLDASKLEEDFPDFKSLIDKLT